MFIYKGIGACTGCPEAPHDLAVELGMNVRYVDSSSMNLKALAQAKVWIQPGGEALDVLTTVNTTHMRSLREWVSRGGSYIGLCAGAFLADSTVDDANTIAGIGLIPGTTYDYLPTKDSTVLPISWANRVQMMYFQAGPAFRIKPGYEQSVQVLARYPDGTPAAIQFRYGKGKVILSGPHPEATPDWFTIDGLQPPPDWDQEMALQMLKASVTP